MHNLHITLILKGAIFQPTAGKFPAHCGVGATPLRGSFPPLCGVFPRDCGYLSNPLRSFSTRLRTSSSQLRTTQYALGIVVMPPVCLSYQMVAIALICRFSSQLRRLQCAMSLCSRKLRAGCRVAMPLFSSQLRACHRAAVLPFFQPTAEGNVRFCYFSSQLRRS